MLSKSDLYEISGLPDADFVTITKIPKSEIFSNKENVVSIKLK